MELGIFKDRIFISADYYRNRSSNQLLSPELPSFVGPSGGLITNRDAVLVNSGFEGNLILKVLNSALSWTTTPNFSINRSQITRYPDIINSPDFARTLIGQPIQTVRVYHLADVDPETGRYRFQTKEGDLTYAPNYFDQNTLVNLAPAFYGGWNNHFIYKRFDLDFTIQFVKQKGFNFLYGFMPGFEGVNQPVSVLNRWQKSGDVTNIQRFTNDFSLFDGYEKARNQSDQSYTDASFIRFKDVALSYDMPNVFTKDNVSSLKIYLQAQNLFTITNYKGLDPETKNTLWLPPLGIISAGLTLSL